MIKLISEIIPPGKTYYGDRLTEHIPKYHQQRGIIIFSRKGKGVPSFKESILIPLIEIRQKEGIANFCVENFKKKVRTWRISLVFVQELSPGHLLASDLFFSDENAMGPVLQVILTNLPVSFFSKQNLKDFRIHREVVFADAKGVFEPVGYDSEIEIGI